MAGFTLLEMLAALAVAATLASFIALSLGGTREARALDQAAAQLAGDLRAARTQARSLGEPVTVSIRPGGYDIERLGLERRWAEGLAVTWRSAGAAGDPLDRFDFAASRLGQPGLTVEIDSGERTRAVRVDAVTGRIHAP